MNFNFSPLSILDDGLKNDLHTYKVLDFTFKTHRFVISIILDFCIINLVLYTFFIYLYQ